MIFLFVHLYYTPGQQNYIMFKNLTLFKHELHAPRVYLSCNQQITNIVLAYNFYGIFFNRLFFLQILVVVFRNYLYQPIWMLINTSVVFVRTKYPCIPTWCCIYIQMEMYPGFQFIWVLPVCIPHENRLICCCYNSEKSKQE